jgi:carbon-monoxide dehydrogenase medium subunit
VIPAELDYARPETVEATLEALATPDARVLAGGQSLLPMMKLRLARPALLVDIAALQLDEVWNTGDVVEIGACVTYDQLLRDGTSGVPRALLESAGSVGDLQVRNRGTVAGAIAHADPSSDVAAAFVAHGGRVRVASPEGSREVSAEDLLLGVFTTSLGPQDLVTHVLVDAERESDGSAYVAFEDRASGYPLAGAAALVRVEGPRVTACALGLTGVGATALRAPAIESAVVESGNVPEPDAISAALAPLPLDVDDYRTHLAAVATRRALTEAYTRALRSET